ncbi:zinc-dependent peptidase [Sphingobacterium spiritivorum]|uniref:M90 family metallopeptidase n=1 Tax=Sphingobacterium spiritivorum TaxID=258 RepID=UPI003DA562F7
MQYNPVVVVIIIFIIGIVLVYYVMKNVSNKKIVVDNQSVSLDEIQQVLHEEVGFYKGLNPDEQLKFCNRVSYFLNTTRISAEKGVQIVNADKILVAASATIPLFHFENWSYENLDEVLIYPGTFSEKFDTEEGDRNILGMVGDGVLGRKMILSLSALRNGFRSGSGENTAIHEFVHLIDKADGETDGIPEYLIPKSLIHPWLKEMHKTISMIKRDKSDIREYAATNEAEFLAVTSEYFFQKPKLLKEDHPELFELLTEIYEKKDA